MKKLEKMSKKIFKNFNKDYIKIINVPCEMTGNEIVEEIEKTE